MSNNQQPAFECFPDEEYEVLPYTKVRTEDMRFNDKILSETYTAQMVSLKQDNQV